MNLIEVVKSGLTTEEAWMFFAFDNLCLIEYYSPNRKDYIELALSSADEFLFEGEYSDNDILDAVIFRTNGKLGDRL